MKKKLMMVAVLLGALSLGACVDDNESQSVTDVRKAKAEQLSALAAKAKAEAEAALITANAEKAYKEAWAKYYEAQAALSDANTDRVLQEIEQSKVKFEAELEAIKAEYERRMWEAKKAAAKAEQEMLDQADERLQNLYITYFDALRSLNDLKERKVNQEYDLARFKAELISANEYIVMQTADYQAQIDKKTAELNAWKTYSGMDKADLEAQELELTQAQYKAFAAYQEKKNAADALEDAKEAVLEVYDVDYEKKSTVAAVAALQELRIIMPNHWWLGETWEEAEENTRASMQQGLCSWDDIKSHSWTDNEGVTHFTYTINAFNVWENGQNLFIVPVKEESYSLSEEVNINVPLYSLRGAKAATMITNYYATDKDNRIEWLGSEASADKLATGLYLSKERAETAVEDANEALTKAETDFPVKEKAYKTAKDAYDVAKKALDDARKVMEDARTGLEEAMNGTDTAAQEAARKALEEAEKAYRTAQEKYMEARDSYDKAGSEYRDAEYKLRVAKENARQAAEELAGVNDDINRTKEDIENWDENAAKWNAIVAALEDATYKTAVEGLSKNADVAAYITAKVAEKEAYDAYWEAYSKANAVNELLWDVNVKDPAEEIRALEKEIAGLNAQIAALKNFGFNGLSSVNFYEKLIAGANAAIESLNSQIQVQEAIVKLAKERLEAAIAETPAE